MLFAFMKVPPTQYVIHFRQGKVKREGAGMSFFYYVPTSTIVSVPVASSDLPFAFQEKTADFQPITLQGQITYRITDPKKVSGLLDFSVSASGNYVSDDPKKLQERLMYTAQILARAVIQRMNLREALTSAGMIGPEVLTAMKTSEVVTTLGIEILGLSILSIKPTPEMAKALEAESREELQRRSDEAIYARRNAAVEQERRIKENELNTEIAVEEKQRQIRETRMSAEIAVEQQRAQLIDQRVQNERKDADSRAYALQALTRPLQDVDWKKLMMLSAAGGDPRQMIALAFQELAANAQKIGELNVSPDLLHSLLDKGAEK